MELHTDTAHDIKAIEYYGRRYHELCPDHFIIKVPYTAEGLIGARKLKDSGIRVNLTLEFSARQNVLVTSVARSDYLNVFLGRIGSLWRTTSLVMAAGLEMAVISSQNWVTALSSKIRGRQNLLPPALGITSSWNCLREPMYLQCAKSCCCRKGITFRKVLSENA